MVFTALYVTLWKAMDELIRVQYCAEPPHLGK